MPATLRRRGYATDRMEMELADFSGLLNINSSPQQVADNEVTIAQNVYGSTDGALVMRKGTAARAGLLGPGSGLGLARFFQQVINGLAQANPATQLLAQSNDGSMYNVDATGSPQVAPVAILGAAPQAWSVRQIYDPQHLQSPPPRPVLTKVAGGSLAAGTYTYGLTSKTAAGETMIGHTASITLTAADVAANLQSINVNFSYLGAIPGATSYNTYGRVGGALGLMSDGTNLAPGTLNYTDVGTGTVGAAPPVSNGAGVAASDVLIIATGQGGPYVWDGYVLYTPASYTAQAAGARWVEVVNGIVWFGGIPAQPSLVVGSSLGTPETLSGSANFPCSLPVQGLCKAGAGANAYLLVGHVRGLTGIAGTGAYNFTQQEFPHSDGVACGRSMIAVEGRVYFVGNSDIYVFDGNAMQGIGLKIRPYVLNDPLKIAPWDLPMNGAHSLTWAFYSNRRIYFFYDSGPSGKPTGAVVWDIMLQGWTTYVGLPLIAAALLDDPAQTSNPAPCVVLDATKMQCYNFEVYNGTGHNVDDAGAKITAITLTKYFKLGRMGAPKKIRRVYPGLFVETFGGSVLVETDYGATAVLSLVAGGPPAGTGIWDASRWDQGLFASGFQNYVGAPATRADFNLTCEAAAFGIQTMDTNPPWMLQEFKVEYVMEPTR